MAKTDVENNCPNMKIQSGYAAITQTGRLKSNNPLTHVAEIFTIITCSAPYKNTEETISAENREYIVKLSNSYRRLNCMTHYRAFLKSLH